MDLNERAGGAAAHHLLAGAPRHGDLGPEAYRFVDWLVSAGQTIWQMLPTTPIGPGDSPVPGRVGLCGQPWMVALEPWSSAGAGGARRPGFAADKIDYRHVLPWREAQLRSAAAGFAAQASAADRAAFLPGVREVAWLDDYALFMALRTAHAGQPWWRWGAR